jgi:hypothetical protein
MNIRNVSTVALALIAVGATAATAQPQAKQPAHTLTTLLTTAGGFVAVQIEDGTNDTVGKIFLTALHDELAKSPRFQEVFADPNASSLGNPAAGTQHPIVVHIVTADPDEGTARAGERTGISEVITLDATYNDDKYTQHLLYANRGAVTDAAKLVMTDVDGLYEEVEYLIDQQYKAHPEWKQWDGGK